MYVSVNWRSLNSTVTKHNMFQVISKDLECETDKKKFSMKHTNFSIKLECLFFQR